MPGIELRLVVAVLVGLSLLPSACTVERSTPPSAQPSPGSSEEPAGGSPTGAREPITKPDVLKVTNAGLGDSRAQIDQAISDLRVVGLWKRLTGHLYSVRFSSRPGRDQVPPDGHLADAYLTGEIEGRAGGKLCDVMFFPAAMRDDLERWRSYHSQGLMSDAAPTERDFYGAIMAHELAHCLGEGKGEKAAMEWERRALDALQGRGPL